GGDLGELVDQPGDQRHVGGPATQGDLVAAHVDAGPGEPVLHGAQHLVTGTEQGDQREVGGDDDAVLDRGGRDVVGVRSAGGGVGHGTGGCPGLLWRTA